MALTPKQKAFVQEYLVDLNATAAAKRAGYSPKTANPQGARLLANVSVQKAIQEAMKYRKARTEVTQDRVVTELAKIAFSDASDVAEVVTRVVPDATGHTEQQQIVHIKDTKRLTPDQRAALAGIKEGKYGIEVTRYDKLKALELLGKHLGMFDGQQLQQDDSEVQIIDDI